MTDRPGVTDLPAATERLRSSLLELERVVVAFSGGADSAYLAWMAHDTLGPAASLAVTAVSPSLAGDEHELHPPRRAGIEVPEGAREPEPPPGIEELLLALRAVAPQGVRPPRAQHLVLRPEV